MFFINCINDSDHFKFNKVILHILIFINYNDILLHFHCKA